MNCINVLASLCLVVLLSGVTIAQNDTTTTTPANNSTTTPAVTTTTDKPTTTTVPSNNTTTTAKSNTTTAAKTTPTTTLPTTPATTAAPKEPKNTYNGTDGGKQCIQLIAKIDFEIQYEKTKAGNVTQDVAIPASFETEAHCGNETQTLKIKFFKDWSLEYTFKKDKDSNYHVSGLILQYVLDNNFPGAVHADAKMNVTFNVKSDYMKANADGYVCKSKIGKDNGGVTINTEDLKYKAFSKKGDFDFKNTGLECSADEDTNSIVPIAVGAALAGLVVIVLIAYLIGRKRTRKTGYESV